MNFRNMNILRATLVAGSTGFEARLSVLNSLINGVFDAELLRGGAEKTATETLTNGGVIQLFGGIFPLLLIGDIPKDGYVVLFLNCVGAEFTIENTTDPELFQLSFASGFTGVLPLVLSKNTIADNVEINVVAGDMDISAAIYDLGVS